MYIRSFPGKLILANVLLYFRTPCHFLISFFSCTASFIPQAEASSGCSKLNYYLSPRIPVKCYCHMSAAFAQRRLLHHNPHHSYQLLPLVPYRKWGILLHGYHLDGVPSASSVSPISNKNQLVVFARWIFLGSMIQCAISSSLTSRSYFHMVENLMLPKNFMKRVCSSLTIMIRFR